MLTNGQILFLVIIGWLTLLYLIKTVSMLIVASISANVYKKMIESDYVEFINEEDQNMFRNFMEVAKNTFGGSSKKKEEK